MSLLSHTKAFMTPNQSRSTIEEIREKTMSLLFGGSSTDSFSNLRCRVFCKKVTSSNSFVTPERLPPTVSATRFHSLRVYIQIMVWTGQKSGMAVEDWGWKLENNHFVPIMTEGDSAPEHLLKMIHCNCTTACKSSRCSCRRYGLPCTSACGQCQTDNCENPHKPSCMEEADGS